MDELHGHRRFARTWAWITAHEGKREREARRRVLAGLSGRVLEIGFGVGTNWQYLPEGADYAGVEPDPHMFRIAEERAPAAGRQLDLRRARAESLPFPDASFDAVFSTLTFCTVEDVPAALAEIQRVLKPGGEFRFWEHVRPRGPLLGMLSDAAAPLWRRLGGGCNLNRRTAVAFRRSGFEFREFRRVTRPPLPMIFGAATRPVDCDKLP